MYGTDVVVRKTFDVGFLADNGNGDKKPKTLLGQIADNTQETVNILRTAVLGPSQQDLRDEGISKGDTDPPTKDGGRGFGNRLKGIGQALDKVNPFSSNFAFGNIGRVLLAGGGLLLINAFRDNLIGPLASLLETIKTSDIGGNLTEVKDYLVDKGIAIFEGIKTTTIAFIDGVKTVSGLIAGAYNAVQEYIMQFDTRGKVIEAGPLKGLVVGDGTLDETELAALGEDIKENITTFISDLFEGMFSKILPAIGAGLLGFTFISGTVRRIMAMPTMAALASQAPMMGGKPIQGPIKPGPIGAGTYFNIAGLLLYGITTTYMNVQQAYADTLDENNGVFEAKKFLANFLGGDDQGGLLNGLAQAFKLGGTGTLLGMSIGAFGGPAGIIMGGLVGMGVGALTGLITGYAGSDAMENVIKNVTESVDGAMDTIGNLFTDTIDGLNNIAQGGSFSDTKIETAKLRVTTFMKSNPTIDLMNMTYDQAVDELQRLKALGVDEGGISNSQFRGKLNHLRQLYGKHLGMKDDSGERVGAISILKGSGTKIDTLSDQMAALVSEKQLVEGMNMTQFKAHRGIGEKAKIGDSVKTAYLASLDRQIADLQDDINIGLDINKRDLSTTGTGGGGGAGLLINTTGNTTNSNNTAVNNNSLGGLTVGNQDLITEELIKGVR